jgi:hypothetical protein
MNRGTGTGLMGGGIVLIAIGAVLYWGVTVSTAGWFNISTIGLILFWIGIAALVIGAIVLLAGGRSRSTMHEDVRRTPSGTERTRESEDWRAAS